MPIRVRYTGIRTGAPAIAVRPFGTLYKGDVVEVPDDIAARWLQPHRTGRFRSARELADGLTREQLLELVKAKHPHISTSGSKYDIAERLVDHDPSMAPEILSSDFESVVDEPTEAPAAPEDSTEGVNDGG